MKVAFLVGGMVPMAQAHGNGVHASSIVETFVRRGHEVHLICYRLKDVSTTAGSNVPTGANEVAAQEWRDKGVSVTFVAAPPRVSRTTWEDRWQLLRRLCFPEVGDFYEGTAYTKAFSEILTATNPDAIVAWTMDGVAAWAPPFQPRRPRLATLTDLDHLVRQFHRRFKPAPLLMGKFYQWLDAVAERRLPGVIISLLRDCEVVIDHAFHHNEWLRQQGVGHAKYLPVPVLDHAGSNWREDRDALLAHNSVPRIMLVGNVAGIATLPGVILLAEEILPALERMCPPGTFELHIIGGGKLAEPLANRLKRPCVKWRGFVEDVRSEFRAADIVLVPTPIDLGFRTRISEAFSFGCCVVAHTANACGMPELKHGVNALLDSSGVGLARALKQALDNPVIRRQLEGKARNTFEQELDGFAVCSRMVADLEKHVDSPGKQPSVTSVKS